MQLSGVEPAIWRRVLVPGSARLNTLSEVLLAAMGWSNSHVHAFRVGEKDYGMHVDDWTEDEIDEKEVTVLQALGDAQSFSFDYDFGDGWVHEVAIEEITWPDEGLTFAVCVDGENACPPEDVGGVAGYAGFLEAIADPEHEEHEEYLEWVGGAFDPAAFDVGAANAACQRIRSTARRTANRHRG